MAPGAQFSVTVDAAVVKRTLAKLVTRSADLKAPMKAIGAAMVQSTEQRFLDTETPDGKDWPAVSPTYAIAKLKRGRDPRTILRDRGYLMQSVTYLADRFGVAIGSNKTQAAIQQLGGTSDMAPGPADIPARPYLGISPDDEGEIAKVLEEHLAGALA